MTAIEHAEATLAAVLLSLATKTSAGAILAAVEAAMQDARAEAIAECAEVAGKVAYQCRQRENGHGYYDARFIHSEILTLAHKGTVDHSKTFVRGVIMHTNFAVSYHSLLKRGIIGAFHHVSDKHLPRYLAEFDRRWNTRKERDGMRTIAVIETAIGKRLTYKTTIQ